MKNPIVRVSSAVWTVGFLVTACCSLSVPPGDLGFFVGLFCIALIPALLGGRRYRFFGMIAVSLSLLFAGLQVVAGKRIEAQRARAAAETSSTNSAANQQK